MLIKSQLSQNEFIRVNLVLLYGKTSTKIFTVAMSLFLIAAIVAWLTNSKVSGSLMMVPVIMLTALPLTTYFGTKRIYASSKMNSDPIEYHFGQDYLTLKGESFDFRVTYENLYQVQQTKNWILVWQTVQLVNPIPRRDVSEECMGQLRQILNSHGVKNNL